MTIFQPAERVKTKLTTAIEGPTGSGKTVDALRLAFGLCGDWSKVFAIGTVSESTQDYVNDSRFDIGQFMFVHMPPPYNPNSFLKLAQAAVSEGAQVIIIDSLSQMWTGKGGMLEMHQRQGGKFQDWGKVNPEYDTVMEYLTSTSPVHVIVTLRSKMKHALEEFEQGNTIKARVVRLGVEPIARPGAEYDFKLVFSKNREDFLADVVTMRGSMLPSSARLELNFETGMMLAKWASEGGDIPQETATTPPQLSTEAATFGIQEPDPKGNGKSGGKIPESDRQAQASFTGDEIKPKAANDWTTFYNKTAPAFGLAKSEAVEMLKANGNDCLRVYEVLKANWPQPGPNGLEPEPEPEPEIDPEIQALNDSLDQLEKLAQKLDGQAKVTITDEEKAAIISEQDSPTAKDDLDQDEIDEITQERLDDDINNQVKEKLQFGGVEVDESTAQALQELGVTVENPQNGGDE